MEISTLKNNCTLVAVKTVMAGTVTDDEIIAAFEREGYVRDTGMTHHRWTKASTHLGLELEAVDVPRPRTGRWVDCHNPRTMYGDYTQYRRDHHTLMDFVKDNPLGVFLVSLRNHAIVVYNGAVWDPNCAREGMSRAVEAAKRVLNPPISRLPTGCVRWIKPKRVGSKTWERWRSAMQWIGNNGPTEAAMLIANTRYTRADYQFDLKRGNIRYE